MKGLTPSSLKKSRLGAAALRAVGMRPPTTGRVERVLRKPRRWDIWNTSIGITLPWKRRRTHDGTNVAFGEAGPICRAKPYPGSQSLVALNRMAGRAIPVGAVRVNAEVFVFKG